MKRIAIALAFALVAIAAPAGASAQTPATPPCPQVQGWIPAGTFGPIDTGLGVQFQCIYSLPGQPQLLTLDMHWIKPTARDVDVDFSQCGRPSSGGAYYTDIYSGSNLVHEEYLVNSGSAAGNAAVFQAEQQHIQQAAYVLMTATEALAKSCTPSGAPTTPPPSSTPPASAPAAVPSGNDTAPPTVHVRPARGRLGRNISFRFTIADDSGHVDVLLRIYQGTSNSRILMNHDYGTATAPPQGRLYSAMIRAHRRGTNLWCLTATDAAGNHATACSSVIVR
jgi:hypothetical protein